MRYGLFVHAGVPTAGAIEAQWKSFAIEPSLDLTSKGNSR